MDNCVALKADGIRCSNRQINGTTYCGMHNTSRQKTGPNKYAVKQLDLLHKNEVSVLETTYNNEIGTVINAEHHAEITRQFSLNMQDMRSRHRITKRNLIQEQQQLILQTGIDPDAQAQARRAIDRAAAVERAHQRVQHIEIIRAQRLAIQQAAGNAILANNPAGVAPALAHAMAEAAGPAVARPLPVRVLAHFIADPQNVHTSDAVRQTKEIVARVRQIPVPDEYKWHAINSSKTPFEIGLECNLSQSAAWQMMSQYAQAISIYDIEPGIYGKVLDSVWQYVKASPEKVELCKIMRQELQDNVGMCAQGNLSRVCNILSGYLDGVAPPESIADKLGRLLPPLMGVEDAYDRFIQAITILRDNRVDRTEWAGWLDALIVDEEDREAMMDVLVS